MRPIKTAAAYHVTKRNADRDQARKRVVDTAENFPEKMVVRSVPALVDMGDMPTRKLDLDILENAIKLLQCVVRRWLVKREMQNIRKDRTLTFNRRKLVVRLKKIPAIRQDYSQGVMHFAFCAVYFVYFGLLFSTTQKYASGGFVKDTIWGNEFAGSSTGKDIRGVADVYKFLRQSILAQMDDESSFAKGTQIINGPNLYQDRAKVKECDWTLPGLLGTWSDGNCAQPDWRTNPNSEEYGGDLVSIRKMIEQFNRFYPVFVAKTPCPRYTPSEDDRFAIPFKKENGVANNTLIVDYIEECNFFDYKTRRMDVEMTLLTGNVVPIVIILTFSFNFNLYSSVSSLYAVSSMEATEGYTTTTSQVALTFGVCLMVMCFLGVCINIGDILSKVIDQGVSYTWYFTGYWTFHALLTYLLITTEVISWLIWNESKFSMISNASVGTFTQFREDARDVQLLEMVNSVLSGCAAFFLVTKTLMYFKHQGMLAVLYQSLSHVAWTLAHFLVALVVVFIGFVLLFHQVFGAGVESFSLVTKANNSLFTMALGDFDFSELYIHRPIISPFFFGLFQVLFSIIVLNFFVAIVLESYTEVISHRRYQLTVSQLVRERYSHLRELPKHLCPAEMVCYLLEADLHRQKTVNLFELKARLPLPMNREVLTVLYDELYKNGVNDVLIEQVAKVPYRFCLIGPMHGLPKTRTACLQLYFSWKGKCGCCRKGRGVSKQRLATRKARARSRSQKELSIAEVVGLGMVATN